MQRELSNFAQVRLRTGNAISEDCQPVIRLLTWKQQWSPRKACTRLKPYCSAAGVFKALRRAPGSALTTSAELNGVW